MMTKMDIKCLKPIFEYVFDDFKWKNNFLHLKLCENRSSEANIWHTRYAYRYGRVGKSDCDVTRVHVTVLQTK